MAWPAQEIDYVRRVSIMLRLLAGGRGAADFDSTSTRRTLTTRSALFAEAVGVRGRDITARLDDSGYRTRGQHNR